MWTKLKTTTGMTKDSLAGREREKGCGYNWDSFLDLWSKPSLIQLYWNMRDNTRPLESAAKTRVCCWSSVFVGQLLFSHTEEFVSLCGCTQTALEEIWMMGALAERAQCEAERMWFRMKLIKDLICTDFTASRLSCPTYQTVVCIWFHVRSIRDIGVGGGGSQRVWDWNQRKQESWQRPEHQPKPVLPNAPGPSPLLIADCDLGWHLAKAVPANTLFDLWVGLTLAGSPQHIQMFRQAMRETAKSGRAVLSFLSKKFWGKLKILAGFLLDI